MSQYRTAARTIVYGTILLILPFVDSCAGREETPYDRSFFNLYDLNGWTGTDEYWSVENKEIVGRATEEVPKNEFLFSDAEVGDFYLSVQVKQSPPDRNSGIQFRSLRGVGGHAAGYQADIGLDYWGRLYDEHGRGKLDWTDEGEKHVKPYGWNHYEILAVDHRIWTAINGHLSVAYRDPEGALTGFIALQIHSGLPQEVRFKEIKLLHNPTVELVGMDEGALNAALRSGLPDD